MAIKLVAFDFGHTLVDEQKDAAIHKVTIPPTKLEGAMVSGAECQGLIATAGARQAHNCHVNVRKLAAIDLFFLGPRLILAEFATGVLGSLALGVTSAWRGAYRFHSTWMVLFGIYLIFVGMNYVPLLLHAIDISRKGSAEQELAEELKHKKEAFRRYRRQSVWLLVPLAVIIAAIQQRNRTSSFGAGRGV